MTDCFKTRAPNAEASRPAASDSGTAGYFKNFSACDANDGTPITADWANAIIDALTEVVVAAKAADPTFDDATCTGILLRAIQALAPDAQGVQYLVLSDDGQATVDDAPIGAFYLDDQSATGGFFHKVPNGPGDTTGTWVEYINPGGGDGGGASTPSEGRAVVPLTITNNSPLPADTGLIEVRYFAASTNQVVVRYYEKDFSGEVISVNAANRSVVLDGQTIWGAFANSPAATPTGSTEVRYISKYEDNQNPNNPANPLKVFDPVIQFASATNEGIAVRAYRVL